MDSLLALRKQFKVDGIKLSINDVIVKAVGTALQLCPEVNVVWKGDEVARQKWIHFSTTTIIYLLTRFFFLEAGATFFS